MLENEGATAEVEEVKETVDPVVEKTMEETIRETLDKLKVQDSSDEVSENPDQEKSEKPEKISRKRDDKGKFAEEKSPETEVAKPAAEVIAKTAPNTWTPQAQAKFATLDPIIQAEVERREADFHKGIEQYKQKAQFSDIIEKTITPFMGTINALNITPDVAIKELLQADHKLRYGSQQEKQSYFAELAQAYGVDLGQVQPIQQQQIDPRVQTLQQRLNEIENRDRQRTMLEQQQEARTLNSEIAKFASDPAHSHFEELRNDMAELLQAQLATSLQDAYEQASWRNHATRAALIAEQQAAAKAEATKKAQAAKEAASVNVRARPSMPTSAPIGTMDETIKATLQRLKNA